MKCRPIDNWRKNEIGEAILDYAIPWKSGVPL